MYVIKAGRVRLSKTICNEEIALEELGPGEFCGELALINDQPRPVTAMVTREARLIAISSQKFENMIASNSDIALRMMKKMCQRLTQAQYRISNMALRSPAARLLHQLRQEASRHSDQAPVPIPSNITSVLGIELGELKSLLSTFVRDEMIAVDRDGNFRILDQDAVDRYLRFLELGDRFEFRRRD
jgi:CRP-like cAMP-binding protein